MSQYLPLYFEVHADFAKAGIPISKSTKFGGKTEPIILQIDPQLKKIAYYTRDSILILAAELHCAYHADPLPGTGNGFIVKFRNLDKSSGNAIHDIEHILACCDFDSRRERDILVSFFRTTQSRDGVMEYFLEKYYHFPKQYVKGVEQLKDDDKKPAKVVSTLINTLIFNPPSNPIPRRALLHATWQITNDPKKPGVECLWHPPSTDKMYKKQQGEWNNKKSRLFLYAESAQQSTTISEWSSAGKHYLQSSLPPLPTNSDALKEEMFEKQAKLLQIVTPSGSISAIQNESLHPSTPSATRRETLSLEQQAMSAQKHGLRQRASAMNTIDSPNSSPTPSLSSSSPLVSITSAKPTGKRSTLFAQAKVSTSQPHASTIAPIHEDYGPPPPPPDDDDLPPPPPPDGMGKFISPGTGLAPPPPPDDDDLPPLPPGGAMGDYDCPPPPPGAGPPANNHYDDDIDDDEPPPPGGLTSQFKAASKHVIVDQLVLNHPGTTSCSDPSIAIEMDMPPPIVVDGDMPPLQPLAKDMGRTRGESTAYQVQLQQQFLSPSPRTAQHDTAIASIPGHNDARIELVEQGNFIKEIRTEIVTDPVTGSRQQRVTETITPRVPAQQLDRSRAVSSALAPDTPLPPVPCPAGCHYRYTSNNPLTRKCQLVMDDSVLGVLDPNFQLPFASTNHEPVYGILPDPSCDLPDNYLMTTNGLIVECRVNGLTTLDDTVIAQVITETPIHLLGRPIARQGQTLTFLAEGCIPGNEVEVESFLPPEDEEMPIPPPPMESPFLATIPTDRLPPTPPTPLSLDFDSNVTTPSTPVFTPSGQHGGMVFSFGAAGVELKILLEGDESEPVGVIEIPSDADPAHYCFSTLRTQILDELDDIPEEFCFLIKGARLTSKQESKRSVSTLSDATVIIRDVKKYEEQKAAEEEAKRLEEERKKQAMAPGRAAPARPAPIPPPGAPRGVPPGTRPPVSQTPPTPTSIPPNRPQISLAALQGGASALKKAPIPEDKAKPPSLLSQLKEASNRQKLNKVDHETIRAEKDKRRQRPSVAGAGMFVSIKAAMAQRRQNTVDDVAEDTDDDWD